MNEEQMYELPILLSVSPFIHKKFHSALYENVDMLYHYTDLNGMVGIVTNKSFWASHIKYMNDSKEYLHGINICNKIINENKEKCTDANFLQFLDALSKLLTKEEHKVFVVSFCPNGDLLSQWRGYGQNDRGVSLGFKLEDLYSHTTQIDNNYFIPYKVIYDEQIQRSIIEEIIRIGRESIKRNMEKYPNLNSIPKDIANHIIETIRLYIPLFKNESFKEENEWRFIITYFEDIDLKKDMQFRVRKTAILPYVELTLHKFLHDNEEIIQSPNIPLNQIIIGPSRDQQLIFDSIRFFLESNNFNNTKDMIKTSSIPFRW